MITKTITTVFMVPTLEISKEELVNNGFINAYIKDEQKDEYPGCIHLVFHPDNVDRFREFLEKEQERTPNVVDNYDYDGGYIVVVYKLNPEFDKDFELVRQGKYSKTSKEFKNLFPKAVKIMQHGLHRDEISLQWRIFKRTTDLVEFWEDKLGVDIGDLEVWDTFYEEKETLNINHLKPITC